jgi:RNA binding exosome subunit
MKGPIQSVEVTYLIHATEDAKKVERAIAEVLGVDLPPEVEKLEGHFGNEIMKVTLHITGDQAGTAFEGIVARLPADLRSRLAVDASEFIDEHSALFLRFDKQSLVIGNLSLGSGDAVRVKVKPRKFLVRGGAPWFYSGLVGGE